MVQITTDRHLLASGPRARVEMAPSHLALLSCEIISNIPTTFCLSLLVRWPEKREKNLARKNATRAAVFEMRSKG